MLMGSRFFLTGSAVLTLMFFLSGAWVMLPIPFFIMLFGIYWAEQEQIDELDSMTISMLVPAPVHSMLLPEQFTGRELLFYQAGSPVYRELWAGKVCWLLVGAHKSGDEAPAFEHILIFPGFVYRRV